MTSALAALIAATTLAGEWQVAGEGFSAKAQLPGTTADAKLGKRWTERDFAVTMDLPQSEALCQEYQYVGKTVWTREIEVSAEEAKYPLEIFLERVMWKSEAFFDGTSLGTCDSLATPHVHPVGRVAPGRHLVRLEIDNSRFYGFSRQSHAYGPNMQAVWNGALGRLELRRSHALRSARVFAAAPANGRLVVEVPDAFKAEAGAIAVERLSVKVEKECASPHRVGFKLVTLALGQEPQAWRPLSPNLYTLTLTDREGDFTHRIRFGFRTCGTRGRHLTLNGDAIFTRGNVENANLARDGVPWMRKEEWRNVFKTLRDEDGVDTIRFHTWCPPGAAFEAADELGMLMQPEAGVWTDGWMEGVADEVGNGKPVDAFVERELRAIVDAYGNSPSLFSLSIGNELGNSNFERMGEMIAALRKYDPRALYYAASARELTKSDDFLLTHRVAGRRDLRGREVLKPHTDWDYEEAYSQALVPSVAHEIGQWPVYPIWDDLLNPFTGTMRPWNLSRHRDTAARKGMLKFQHEFHAASAKLNRLIYKEEVESFLRTPSCSGLQLLEVQDYTGQAEALVGWRGPFYDLKRGFRDLPKFATVWGPVSYLARFPRFVWTAGETFAAELEIRNLTGATIRKGASYPCVLGDRTRMMELKEDLAPGLIARLGRVELKLDDSMTRSKQTLSFGTNRWNFWVYPDEKAAALPAGVVKTSDAAEMKAAIAAGKTVLYTGRSKMSAKGHFKSVYWSARWFPVANTTQAALGTWFDVKHPAFAGFVTEDFTDWQWYSLAEGAEIHRLVGDCRNLKPIGLSVNDFHFSDFCATMFEAFVGKGRLFVCGYDLDADTREARRLRSSIFGYLAGAPAEGTVALSEKWLEEEFSKLQPRDLSGAVYDENPKWEGRSFRKTLKGLPPTTGVLRIDFHQTGASLTSGRGTLEGRVFEVPFTSSKGAKTFVELSVIREDFLDGKLELEVNLMTGKSLAIDRIRLVPASDMK